MADAIHTEQLTKRYGRRRCLDGLDLTVRSGEVCGFLGPNGAGRYSPSEHLIFTHIFPCRGCAWYAACQRRAGGSAV